MSNKKTVYNASEARANFYSILKDASLGVLTYEVTNKHGDSVVMMSKDEYEGWVETLSIAEDQDVLSSINKAKKDPNVITHKQLLSEIELE